MQRLVMPPVTALRVRTRGAAMVVVVVLSIIATTVAAVLVQQLYFSASQERTAALQTQAMGAMTSLRTEVETKLAHNPEFFYNELFWAERPRECPTGDYVVAAGTLTENPTEWPEECGKSWQYPTSTQPVTQYTHPASPARVEFHPPSETNPDLQVIYGATINGTFVAEEVTYTTQHPAPAGQSAPTFDSPTPTGSPALQPVEVETKTANEVCGDTDCWESW